MLPPIFATCQASAGVVAALGSNPLRLFPAGEAPAGVAKPYAVWRTAFGSPENVMDGAPSIDSWNLDVTIYANTMQQARDTAEAIRDAIEAVAYINSLGPDDRDPDTKLYSYSMNVDWLDPR